MTAPPDRDGYVLELDLVHEHVRWFGTPVTVEADVGATGLVLLAGADEPTLAALAAELAESAPGIEPAYVGAAGGDGAATARFRARAATSSKAAAPPGPRCSGAARLL